MKRFIHQLSPLILLGSGLLMAGCTGDRPQVMERHNGDSKWQTSGQSATGYAKTGAPISFSYLLDQDVTGLESLEIPLRLTVASDVSSLEVSFSGMDDLEVIGERQYVLPEQAAGTTVPMTVTVVSNERAGGTLNVFVRTIQQLSDREYSSQRAFSVPLGEVEHKARPVLELGDDGKTYQMTDI